MVREHALVYVFSFVLVILCCPALFHAHFHRDGQEEEVSKVQVEGLAVQEALHQTWSD